MIVMVSSAMGLFPLNIKLLHHEYTYRCASNMQLQFDSDINTQTAQFIGFSTLADPLRVIRGELARWKWCGFCLNLVVKFFSSTHSGTHWVQFFGVV